MLDEPTTGLHFEDTKKLIGVLNSLVEKGNSVFVIEHNLDVVKSCDYVLDLGPEGGSDGGKLVAQGTPEQIAGAKDSYTGDFLKKLLR
jgi:excinuclease ABC subunit A